MRFERDLQDGPEFKLVQGDRETITEVLERDGESLDLTGRTVEYRFAHNKDGVLDTEGTLEITDPTLGEVTVTFTENDLARSGTHYMEFRVLGGPDDPTSIPREKTMVVYVRPSMGSSL